MICAEHTVTWRDWLERQPLLILTTLVSQGALEAYRNLVGRKRKASFDVYTVSMITLFSRAYRTQATMLHLEKETYRLLLRRRTVAHRCRGEHLAPTPLLNPVQEFTPHVVGLHGLADVPEKHEIMGAPLTRLCSPFRRVTPLREVFDDLDLPLARDLGHSDT